MISKMYCSLEKGKKKTVSDQDRNPEKLNVLYNEEVKRPDDYIIYKGGGAIEVALKRGQFQEMKGSGDRPFIGTSKGCIFITGAPAIGKREYNWKEKITLALNEHEVGKLMLGLQKRQKIEFFHDKELGKEGQGQRTKKLQISPTEDGGTLLFRFVERTGDEDRTLKSIPVTAEEAVVLYSLLQAAIPRILGWL